MSRGMAWTIRCDSLELWQDHKNWVFSHFEMVFGRSGGVQGHGMDHTMRVPRTLAGFWSYSTWGKSIFMIFGNIGNSLHHQIPPNWSSGLQIGPRIFLKARVPSQELSNKYSFKKGPTRKIFPGQMP